MGVRETFKGYGPEQGYEWLRAAIAGNDFRARGLDVADDEIFVSDGSKCDCGNILDILGHQNRLAISDPVYPVYVDTNVMAGHTGEANAGGCLRRNRLSALHPRQRVHPRAAQGARRRHLSLLAEQPDRCGRHAAPTGGVGEVRPGEPGGDPLRRRLRGVHHRSRRSRIRSTKSPGPASAPSSSAASPRTADSPGSAAHSPWFPRRCWPAPPPANASRCIRSGCVAPRPSSTASRTSCNAPPKRSTPRPAKTQVRALIDHYLGNAASPSRRRGPSRSEGLRRRQRALHLGPDPAGVGSWQAFDKILGEANVVITPGSGFGSKGEGYFRISAFNSRANAEEVARRLPELRW
jgi:LL-diaminopimelate aminotransferase